jgi:hypothetical protein
MVSAIDLKATGFSATIVIVMLTELIDEYWGKELG